MTRTSFPHRQTPPGRLWPWALAIAGGLLLLAAAVAAFPVINERLEGAVRRALDGAARDSGLSVHVARTSVTLPSSVRMERVELTLQNGSRVFMPDLTVGVELPVVLTSPSNPGRAIRRIEAGGIVVRPTATAPESPGHNPSGPGTPDTPVSTPPDEPTLHDLVARARQVLLDVLRQLQESGLAWLRAGDVVSWRLDGVWEEPAGPEQWIRTPWRTAGELRGIKPGTLEAEGTLSVGGLESSFLAVAQGGRIEVQRLSIDQPGLRLLGKFASQLDPGGKLTLTASGSLDWSQWDGLPPVRVSFQTDGPWTESALPPIDVTVEARAPRPGDQGWPLYLGGAVASARLVQRQGSFEIGQGTLRKGDARGRFSGRIEDAWPFKTMVSFEAGGLKPGVDLPWWDAYVVRSVDMRGTLTGSLSGPWKVDGEVQAPAGRFLDLAASGVAAQVSADFTAGRATIDELVAATGSGLLTLSGRVLWGPSAPVVAGKLPSQVALDLAGRIEGVASTEVLTALQAGLRSIRGQQPPAQRAAVSPEGEVAGEFEARVAWVGSEGPARPTLVRGRFDGPDGTLAVEQYEPERYRISGDLINLGGRALRPWLRSLSGHAAFSGEMDEGRLDGRLEVQGLGLDGHDLGSFTAGVRFADGWWNVPEARLSGGEVEGSLTLRLRADFRSGDATVRLGQRAESSFGAAVAGGLSLGPRGLTLGRLVVRVRDREVASLTGTIPIAALGLNNPPAMDVRVSMERFPLELVQELLPAWQVEGGRLSGALTLAGTPDEPTASGKLSVQADRVASRQDLVSPFRDVLLEVTIDERHLRLAQGRARAAGGGELSLSGDAYLASIWPFRLDPLDLRLAMRQAAIQGRASQALEFEGTLNGELRLAGALGSGKWPVLSGRIGVQQGRVTVLGVAGWLAGWLAPGSQEGQGVGTPAVRLPGPPEQAEGRPAASGGVPLDVTIEADEPVRVEVPAIGGSGLAEGAVVVTGTARAPALSGDVTLSQARVRYFGREFTIERGRLSFSPARGMLPEVDLQASTGTPDGPVRVQMQGDVANLGRMRLSAQPEMSREQILALLLPPVGGGEQSSQLWVAQVNEQLAAWATEPLERAVRKALGLDELWLVPTGEEGGLQLSVGKYISASRVYVRYRRELLGRAPEQQLEFSYRLRPGLTWKLTLGGQEIFRLGLNWQWSF